MVAFSSPEGSVLSPDLWPLLSSHPLIFLNTGHLPEAQAFKFPLAPHPCLGLPHP